jgi:hypothetical protein
MIFAKEVVSACVAIGMGVGCFAGGISLAWSDHAYQRALQDPEFFYLVDEAGNPVSQESNQN